MINIFLYFVACLITLQNDNVMYNSMLCYFGFYGDRKSENNNK